MVLAIVAPTAAAVSVTACGGANEQDLLASDGPSTFGSNPPNSSGGNSSGGNSSGGNRGDDDDDDDDGDDDDDDDDVPPTKDAGGGTKDGGNVKDAAVDATVDSGVDSGTGYTNPGIFCGATNGADDHCKPVEQRCCYRPNADKPYTCQSTASPGCIGGQAFACDDQADCKGGQVCCAILGGVVGGNRAECRTSCDPSAIPGVKVLRLCDPKATVDECAASNGTCGASVGVDGYFACK